MKIKILILFIILFLVTGCDVTYNLKILDDGFQENIFFNAEITEKYSKEYLYNKYKEEYPIYIDQEFMYYDPYSQNEEFEYYKKNCSEQENGYLFNYQATYNYDDFKRARSLNTFYKTIGIGYINTEQYYYLSMKDILIFNYDNNLNSITINIDFDDYEVINSNADNYSNNIYTWYITKDNSKNINVSYKIKEKESEIEQPENSNENETNTENENNKKINELVNSNKIIVYISVFTFLIIIIVIFSVLKNKKH